jgi:hypothetical protein
MRLLKFLPFLLIFIDACVEPLELKDDEFVDALVVDGMITDKPGSYTLTLKHSSRTNAKVEKTAGISGAIVTLHDSEGNSVQYNEAAAGIYVTPVNAIQGIVGRSYHVSISVNGKEYVSKPSKMMPAGTIDAIYGQFEENVINFHDLRLPQDAIRIYFNSTGTPGYPNMFRWRWTGTYEVLTYPDLAVRNGPRGSKIPDPLKCSGLTYNGVFNRVFPCECCQCYVPEYSQQVQVSENSFFSSTEFNNVLLATLPYEGARFFYKYRLKMEQISLDETSYDYWRLAMAQQKSVSDIFQPNTIRMTGNIECVSDPNERVLGIFSASAIVEKTYDVPRTLYNKLMEVSTYYTDCRQTYAGSTNVRPPQW